MQELNLTNTKALLYVDRWQGKLAVDDTKGLWGKITRTVLSLLKFRTYDLSTVLSLAEQEKLSQKNIKYLSQKLAKKCGLSQPEWKALHTFTCYLDPHSTKKLDVDSFKIVAQKAKGNLALNKNLAKFKSKGGVCSVISKEAIDDFSEFAFKTQERTLGKFEAILAKVEFLEQDLTAEFSDEQKLYLEEIRTIESFRKMLANCQRIAFLSEQHEELFEKIKRVDAFVKRILSEAEKEAPRSPCTISAYDVENDASNRGKKPTFFARFLFRWILRTETTHTSICFRDRKGEDMEAHMWGSPRSVYHLSRLSFANRCYKAIGFNVDKFPSNEADLAKFKDFYGDSWEERICEEFGQIVREYLSKKENFEELDNPPFRRLISMIGFRWSLLKKTWRDGMHFSARKQAICSEFTVKALLHCTQKFNEEFEKRWQEINPSTPAPTLEPPIRKYRRLNRVMPHEVVKRAIATGYARVIEPAQIIQKIVKFHQYELAL
jgi:hypothetical protein